MAGLFSKSSSSSRGDTQTTTNTLTDESSNAGGANSVAIGSGAVLEEFGGSKVTSTGKGSTISITDASPEALARAFEFGRDALEAVSGQTERQVSGAVDAARQASEAASRAAASRGVSEALYSSARPNPLASVPVWAWLAGGVALVVGLFVFLSRRPSRR